MPDIEQDPKVAYQDPRAVIWNYGNGERWVAVLYDHYRMEFETTTEIYEKLGIRIKERDTKNAKNKRTNTRTRTNSKTNK